MGFDLQQPGGGLSPSPKDRHRPRLAHDYHPLLSEAAATTRMNRVFIPTVWMCGVMDELLFNGRQVVRVYLQLR
jgi:hypothetical protein